MVLPAQLLASSATALRSLRLPSPKLPLPLKADFVRGFGCGGKWRALAAKSRSKAPLPDSSMPRSISLQRSSPTPCCRSRTTLRARSPRWRSRPILSTPVVEFEYICWDSRMPLVRLPTSEEENFSVCVLPSGPLIDDTANVWQTYWSPPRPPRAPVGLPPAALPTASCRGLKLSKIRDMSENWRMIGSWWAKKEEDPNGPALNSLKGSRAVAPRAAEEAARALRGSRVPLT
mmetsp:Transcript_123424/g.308397  ORF Transcript_123424/g.308397 Transcript_123424/m.308397 type:complete len:232 (-) Transcript_123424:200-895(-)